MELYGNIFKPKQEMNYFWLRFKHWFCFDVQMGHDSFAIKMRFLGDLPSYLRDSNVK